MERRHKRGLRVFWIPKKHSHHKHKKNKYYINDREDSPTRSIMSGDSPNVHKNDLFDFNKDGRSSPVPTTSKDVGVVTASVTVEPEKKDKEEELDISSPIFNQSEDEEKNKFEENETFKLDDHDHSREDNDKIKMNGGDKLDGQWMPEKDKKPEHEEEEDDNCIVKCLYYTLQCCECSIM